MREHFKPYEKPLLAKNFLPMWSYYGSKATIVKYYPPPKYGTIIEPFAGTARYALRYYDRNVLLIDKDPRIVGIWKWLQACGPQDILSLPNGLRSGDCIDKLPFSCDEERWFFGYVIGYGEASPRRHCSNKMDLRPNHLRYTLARIAGNLHKIKHWKVELGSYTDAPFIDATYFIDPPYVKGGHKYRYSNKHIDFAALGAWCRSLPGQVLVCEANGADWLPFSPLAVHKGAAGPQSELIWSNLNIGAMSVKQTVMSL